MVKYKHLLEGSYAQCQYAFSVYHLLVGTFIKDQLISNTEVVYQVNPGLWVPFLHLQVGSRAVLKIVEVTFFLVQALITTNRDAIRLRVWKLLLTLLNLTKRME